MSNYKRKVRFVGKPELLEPIEREYKTLWLQPQNESQVPMQVYVYVKDDGWHGYRAADDPTRHLEIFWIRGLWKEVPSPLPHELIAMNENDMEDTMEATPIPE